MKKDTPTILIWTGAKHSGKSTAVACVVAQVRAQGLSVGGFLASSRYRQGTLLGFDLLDLETGQRLSLAQRSSRSQDGCGFIFDAMGLCAGEACLERVFHTSPELVVVDEYGPLEFAGRGWRESVDRLVQYYRGILVLVVRTSLVSQVKDLYAPGWTETIVASDTGAVDRVLAYLPEHVFGQAHRLNNVLSYAHMKEIEYMEKGKRKHVHYTDNNAPETSGAEGQS